MKYIIFILVLFICSSCVSKVNQNKVNQKFGKIVKSELGDLDSTFQTLTGQGEIIPVSIKEDYLDISSLVDSVVLIPLEATDQSLIGNIDKIICTDDRFYILDKRTSKKLFVFNSQGKFVRCIGQVGRGPGEYLEPSDFVVYPKEDLIIVFDQFGRQLLYYGTDGTFQRNVRLKYILKEIIPAFQDSLLFAIAGDNRHLEEIAKLTAGLAGADLANIINEAALLAGRNNQKQVSQSNLKEAVERGIAGLEKKSRRISPKEKKIVAYHESGHALIAEMTKGASKVNKVSIIPRGMAALGYTLNTPEENKYLMQKHELLAEVDVLLGGRAAEAVFLKEISTGASNDLERATDILKAMISYYGMTDENGLMVLEKQRNAFLGGGIGNTREFSEKTAENVDAFVRKTLDERFRVVQQTLKDYSGAIESMVKELFDKEVIDGAKVREIIESYEKEHDMPSRIIKEQEEEEA